ncbi:MAG: endonuclease III [Gammaproteobacteria bacterium]|nr:endonuclease III [Gammaproteobacteria bacterium]
MNLEKRTLIFQRLQAVNPNPATELIYTTPFECLLAVMLSAQTTDVQVNKATPKLFARANTPAGILALGKEGLKSYIHSIGLYHTKAEHILGACRRLITHHHGEVPSKRQALEALPGVGRKTANVILNVAFGKPTIAVDTHVFRVANRTKLAVGTTPLAVERKLMRSIPKPFRKHAHHWLILHGRYICKARKPLCDLCPIEEYCEFEAKFCVSRDLQLK